MGVGISVFLIAVGAILTFAVEVSVSGLELGTVGVILMIVGGIGLVVALTVAQGLFGPRSMDERTIVEEGTYDDAPPARRRVRRRTYID